MANLVNLGGDDVEGLSPGAKPVRDGLAVNAGLPEAGFVPATRDPDRNAQAEERPLSPEGRPCGLRNAALRQHPADALVRQHRDEEFATTGLIQLNRCASAYAEAAPVFFTSAFDFAGCW